MELNRGQLRLLRALQSQGCSNSLARPLLNSCGATLEDLQALLDAKLVTTVVELGERYVLTAEGSREYRRQAKGRYF